MLLMKTVCRSVALTAYEADPIAEHWIILAVINCILDLVPYFLEYKPGLEYRPGG